MQSPILSASAILGADVFSGKGEVVGVIEDIVWNKDSGKVSYLIISSEVENDPSPTFAVHHSYFYHHGTDHRLTFNPKLGKDEQDYFLDLPVQYEEVDVQDLPAFNRYLFDYAAVATHRSDNDGPVA